VNRLLKYGDKQDYLESIGITTLDAKDITNGIQRINKNTKLEEIERNTVKYQWTAKADQHNLKLLRTVRYCESCCSTVISPFYLNCCLCFIPLGFDRIFFPVEEKSVRYQWTSKMDVDNLNAVDCLECCCSRVLSPISLIACLCFIPRHQACTEILSFDDKVRFICGVVACLRCSQFT